MRICKLDVADQIWGRGGPLPNLSGLDSAVTNAYLTSQLAPTPSTPPVDSTFTVSPNNPNQPSITVTPGFQNGPTQTPASITIGPDPALGLEMGFCPNLGPAPSSSQTVSQAGEGESDGDADGGASAGTG